MEKKHVPFVSEVETFNEVMGKGWQNRTTPTIDKADADFVINFIQEELDELKANQARIDVEIAEAEARATAKAALLEQLGITEEQAKLLLS